MTDIPVPIFLLCKQGAYLVGSYAKYLLGGSKKYKDYDLIVPPDKWCCVAQLIPKSAKLNNYGGFKYTKDGCKIDIWPCSIEHYLRQTGKSLETPKYVLDYINGIFFTSERRINND